MLIKKSDYDDVVMQSQNVVSETFPQYVLQSEMGKSNTQYRGIFKVICNYTASCVTC